MNLPYLFPLVRSGSSVRPSNNVIDKPSYAVGLNPVRRIPGVQTAYAIGVNNAANSPLSEGRHHTPYLEKLLLLWRHKASPRVAVQRVILAHLGSQRRGLINHCLKYCDLTRGFESVKQQIPLGVD
jgi:hypothetical protein